MSHFLHFTQTNKSTHAETAIKFLKLLRRYLLKRGHHNTMNEQLLRSIKNIINPAIQKKANELDKSLFIRNNLCTKTEQQKFDLMSYQIPYYLGVADSCSMANSVENRSPYLDYRLAKYLNIKDRQKSVGGVSKISLRSAMPKNIPENVIKHKEKIWDGYQL